VSDEAVSVYRAPMRSRRDDVPAGAGVRRALAVGLCGMGGLVDPPPDDLDDAVAAVAGAYDDRAAHRLRRFAAIPAGAFVWTRSPEGDYWLGRLTGPWRYDASPAARTADLVHVRACDWLPEPVPEADVPPATVRTFGRGGRNLQQTHDPAIAAQTLAVWRRHRHPA